MKVVISKLILDSLPRALYHPLFLDLMTLFRDKNLKKIDEKKSLKCS